MIDLPCDVCGESHPTNVVAAGPGPCSYLYCQRCLRAGYMPYPGLVAYLYTVWPEVVPEFVEGVKATLAFLGKTMEEFEADIAEANKALDEYMDREARPAINLWLDDVRPAPEDWTWAKTVDEAKELMRLHNVQSMSLDHDLGACDDCYRAAGIDPTIGDEKFDLWLEKSQYQAMPHCTHFGTGYDFCLWMAEKGRWPAERPVVHSANPVGARAMRQTIERYFPG